MPKKRNILYKFNFYILYIVILKVLSINLAKYSTIKVSRVRVSI